METWIYQLSLQEIKYIHNFLFLTLYTKQITAVPFSLKHEPYDIKIQGRGNRDERIFKEEIYLHFEKSLDPPNHSPQHV